MTTSRRYSLRSMAEAGFGDRVCQSNSLFDYIFCLICLLDFKFRLNFRYLSVYFDNFQYSPINQLRSDHCSDEVDRCHESGRPGGNETAIFTIIFFKGIAEDDYIRSE